MKYLLLLIALISFNTIKAQTSSIVIKAPGQTVTSSLEDDNSDKTLSLQKQKKLQKTDKVVIYNGNYNKEKAWKRTFTIFDESDAEIIRFPSPVKERYYNLPMKDLQSKLQKDKTYSLYTIAIPKDSNKAATVRVRRILICKITVK